MGKSGFRILPSPPRLDAALVAAFRGLASSNVADAMGRFNFMDPGIQSRSGLPLCGLAVTVNARPADNLMVHKALQLAEPGDIVVVTHERQHDERGVRRADVPSTAVAADSAASSWTARFATAEASRHSASRRSAAA